MKTPTNEMMLTAFFNDIKGSIHTALLRERIVHIMKLTMDSIEKNPKAWSSPITNPKMYQDLNDIVQKHLGFGDENIHTK